MRQTHGEQNYQQCLAYLPLASFQGRELSVFLVLCDNRVNLYLYTKTQEALEKQPERDLSSNSF